MALAYLTINLDAFTGDDRPPLSSYSTITLDPGADHIDAAADVIHVRTIVVSLDQQGKAATANGVPCVDGKVPVVAGVAYAVSAPNVLRGGPHYIPALTAGQVVALSDYITPGTPLTPDQAATLTARIVALEGDHPQYALANGTRGAFAAPLGADDNYVTDAEKAALHTHPAVIAQGATQADARAAIGAGTSSLVVGTGAGDAKAGNYQPTAANVSDSTATGRALLTAPDAAAARTALALGTAATTAATAYATAAQGAKADTAAQKSANLSDLTSASAARAAIGAVDGTLVAVGSVSGTVILNATSGGTQTFTLTANTTIIPPSATAGTSITLALTQGSGAPWTVTWSPRIAWQTTPVLSLTAGLTDVVTLVNIDGWGWYGFVSGAGITTAPRAIVDTFTRANAATLGTTETGEAWTSTDWSISSGTALPTVGAGTTLAFVNTGQADAVKVSFKITNAAQTARPYVRSTVTGTTYYRMLYSSLAASNCQIQRNDGSGFANIGGTFAFAGAVGDRLGLSVTVTAGIATLKAWRNNTEIYSTTDATPVPAATYAGMMGLSTHAVGDFRVDYL